MNIKKIKIKSYYPYIPLVVLIFLLSVSWIYLNNSQIKSREELHSVLQQKVQDSITQYLEKKHPDITSITFHKIWTKNTEDEYRIQIFFSYSFVTKKESSNLLIDGQAFLVRTEEDENKWMLNDFRVTDSFLEFSEPMVIHSLSQK